MSSQAQELTEWHEVKSQEREVSRRGFYIPQLEKGMSRLLGSTSKKYASLYYLQLKVGHGAVGTYLAKIEAIETPNVVVLSADMEERKAKVHEDPFQR